MQIQKVNSDHVTRWFSKSFEKYKTQAGMLILIFIISLIVRWVIGAIPILGFPISGILSLLLYAGWFYSSEKVINGEELNVSDLFKGFKKNTGSLVILGIINLLLMTLTFIPFVILFGIAFLKNIVIDGNFEILSFSLGFISCVMIALFILYFITAATVFAIPLIFFDQVDVTEAMGLSFKAIHKNFWAFNIYGLIFVALFILSILTVGLGFFVTVPMTSLSLYLAYKEMFTSQTPAALAATVDHPVADHGPQTDGPQE